MLKKNTLCPSFKALDENNNEIKIDDYLGKKSIVLFFYPKDNTPGCTAEVCSFRDQYELFSNLNCELFGISSDGVFSHSNFKEKYKLPFKLLSETSRCIFFRQLQFSSIFFISFEPKPSFLKFFAT